MISVTKKPDATQCRIETDPETKEQQARRELKERLTQLRRMDNAELLEQGTMALSNLADNAMVLYEVRCRFANAKGKPIEGFESWQAWVKAHTALSLRTIERRIAAIRGIDTRKINTRFRDYSEIERAFQQAQADGDYDKVRRLKAQLLKKRNPEEYKRQHEAEKQAKADVKARAEQFYRDLEEQERKREERRRKREEAEAREYAEQHTRTDANGDFDFSDTETAVTLTIDDKTREMVHQIISAGFKALPMKLHPDRGGSNEQMQKLNAAMEWLRIVVPAQEVGQ